MSNIKPWDIPGLFFIAKKRQKWRNINETVEFCKAYTGDKKEYLDHIKENIEKFLPVLEEELKMFENEEI